MQPVDADHAICAAREHDVTTSGTVTGSDMYISGAMDPRWNNVN